MKRVMVCAALGLGLVWPACGVMAQETTVYRCPGKVAGPDGRRSDEYTNLPTPQQAKDLGCRTIEGAPITIIQSNRPRAPVVAAPSAPAASRPEGTRVPSADQRARDDERRTILEAELRNVEEKLALAKQEYNNGEPERRGDERNYAKYQARVEELKATIARHEGDIASIKREIAKLP